MNFTPPKMEPVVLPVDGFSIVSVVVDVAMSPALLPFWFFVAIWLVVKVTYRARSRWNRPF